MSKKIKLSDYVAKFLSEISEYTFSGHGSSVVHLLDSIDKRDNIKNIPSQNEQGAALAADAYSRVTGKIGISIATSGPGIINLLQGIGCSYFDSIPHLIISGAVPTNNMRNNKNIRQVGFQEMEVVDIVKPLTKYAVLLTDADLIKYELEKLVFYSFDGRPGPTLLDLPDDLQRAYIDPSKLKSFKIKNKKITNINNKVLKTISLMAKSKRPVIIVGNGVNISRSKKKLDKFLKKTNIPFAPTWATIDLYPPKTKNFIGSFGVAATRHGNFVIQNSDLLICLGTRLSYQLTGSDKTSFAPNAKKIVVDIDKFEIKKTHSVKIDLSINSCVSDFFNLINKHKFILKKKEISKWIFWINDIKKKYPICEKKYYLEKNYVNPYVFFNELSPCCKSNDIIIPDASANLIWAYQAFKPKKGQKVFTALNHSPMGYSVAASVGAKFGALKKNVIAIIGDGSVAMNVQEFETIAHNKLPIKIFIMNNNGYGLIKGTLELFLEKNYVGVDPSSGLGIPDFKKIAYSYNIPYRQINNHTNIQNKINNILKLKTPVICDVKVNPNQRVIPKLESGNPIHRMSPLLDEFEINKKVINTLKF